MKNSNTHGFTLIEMMVVVAMLGVLMMVGIPTYRSMIVTSDVADTTNELIMALKKARSEALKRGKNVIVCSSTDGETCSGAAGNWIKGWLVYVDENGNGVLEEKLGELLWVKQMDDKTQLTITPINSNFDMSVDYSYQGMLADGVAGGFNICSGYAEGGYPRREITISVSGGTVFNKNTAVKC